MGVNKNLLKEYIFLLFLNVSLKNDHDDYFCSSTRYSFPISIEKISDVRTYEFKEKFQRIFVVIENCHRFGSLQWRSSQT